MSRRHVRAQRFREQTGQHDPDDKAPRKLHPAPVELRPEHWVDHTRCAVLGLEDEALWRLQGHDLLAYCRENYPQLILDEIKARAQAWQWDRWPNETTGDNK
jgi:hypothetical protein